MSSLPVYEPSYIHSADQLRSESRRLGLDLPVSDDLSVLHTPLHVGNRTVPNRFVALPIRAMDAEEDGTPGRLTKRRACRAAAGGFGLIWVEGVEVDPTVETGAGHLRLREENLSAFSSWLTDLRAAGDSPPLVILQLVCSRTLSACSDDDLDAICAAYVRCAGLAEAAGFDGVDVVCAHRGLLAESLVAHNRSGPFGGL